MLQMQKEVKDATVDLHKGSSGKKLDDLQKRALAQGSNLQADKETEIVIEAYMRSANTFSVVAFQMSQERPVRLAHHLHAPIQLVDAARRGIPALSIVRHPGDAAASVTIRSPHVSLEQALAAYTRFYLSLAGHADRCMVVRFEDVTSDLGAVIGRLNERFGTAFTPCRSANAGALRGLHTRTSLNERT